MMQKTKGLLFPVVFLALVLSGCSSSSQQKDNKPAHQKTGDWAVVYNASNKKVQLIIFPIKPVTMAAIIQTVSIKTSLPVPKYVIGMTCISASHG